jgi:hypothetical protein
LYVLCVCVAFTQRFGAVQLAAAQRTAATAKFEALDAATRKTRANDLSDDDGSDLDNVFEAIVVSRTSTVGMLMARWHGAARKRLGGEFPRPTAKEEMDTYAKKMKIKVRASVRARTLRSAAHAMCMLFCVRARKRKSAALVVAAGLCTVWGGWGMRSCCV